MGSVVVGPGAGQNGAANGTAEIEDDSEQTLADFKYVVGDYVACCVLPPLANGVSYIAQPLSFVHSILDHSQLAIPHPMA